MGQQKTALVLSAGGFFGAYQAGAWKTLAGRFRPDIVVGASVGALNGWMIAAGASPEHLIESWRHPSAGGVLRLYPDAGWRRGWFDPAPLRARAEHLVTAYKPVIPFGLVVVRMPWLRTALVRYPDITAAHLQATCSIPYFLPSVPIDGRRWVDGGLLEKLPIAAAVQMGATRIVAIDSLPQMGPWWLRTGANLLRACRPSRHLPNGLEITTVSPSEWLGDANDAVCWKGENIDRWVEMGARDTQAALPSIAAPL
jgi:NTE family protein